jgi:hypothetical protein
LSGETKERSSKLRGTCDEKFGITVVGVEVIR